MALTYQRPVALKCNFSRGAFSDERHFEVTTVSGQYTGLSSSAHCWTATGERLSKTAFSERSTVQGLVSALMLEQHGDHALVNVPDGEVISVPKAIIEARPGAHNVSV